ncbi:hypothetical protein [Croceicoccus pelagius]|uniref:Uncharacterized protein n=1 Tax=Croceicoccus pelagius TaxID=1703341 RepID=A0A916Y7R4_9SPHN|nr:hypothetical protein [Croceicoccus pelagius]GGD33818.1 hypothetical protein GCM10010989_04980 [Croceicoccus pelagius]
MQAWSLQLALAEGRAEGAADRMEALLPEAAITIGAQCASGSDWIATSPIGWAG